MAFTLPIPPDTALITDDGCATGLALVDTATGAIIGFTAAGDFACGSESGMVMLDGTIATPNNSGGAGDGIVSIYDAALALIADAIVGTPGDSFPTGTTTDRVTYWYIIHADGGDALTLTKLSKTGTVLDTWDLSTTFSSDPVPCAVTRDNTFLYFVSDFSGTIKKIDLSNGTITTAATLGTLVSWLGIDTDGNIYVNRTDSGVPVIEKYDSSFSLQDSVAGGPTGYALDAAHFSADDAHLFTWTQKNSGSAHPNKLSAIRKIRLSDLAVISDVTDIPTESNSSFIDEGTDISNSCPFMISGTPTAVPIQTCAIWPVWFSDDGVNGETFAVFSGSYLGNGRPLRFDFDGNLVQSYPYDPTDFPQGMQGMAGMLDPTACLTKGDPGKGMLWLAGHHSPPDSVTQSAVLPFKLSTAEVLQVVRAVPAESEVDESAGFTALDFPSGDGNPTDQGLPPKPSVSCGPVSNLKTPTPNPGCNNGGLGSTPSYTGPSGVVPEADDPTDEATLTGKRDVIIWTEIQHTEYNDDDTETADVLRYAHIDLPDAVRKEGRLAQAGTIEQASSDGQGNMKSTSADLVIFDAPGRPIATRRADRKRLNFNRDEMTVYAISDADRRAGLRPKMLGRVLLYGDSNGTPLTAKLHGVDHLFVEGGSFSPDKTMPMFRYPLGHYTNAPADLANFFMPVIYGEATDNGAKDPTTGLPSERGKCTPRLVDPASPLFGETYGRFNNNLFASYLIHGLYGSDCGGLGCFGMEAVSDGKKPNSTITLTGRGDFSTIPAGGWAQLVLWTENGRSEHRITRINVGANSVRVEGEVDADLVNGAVDWMIERIDHAPRRVKISIFERQGFDVMIPGYPGYTRPAKFEDFIDPTDGRKWRVTDFGIRGPLLREHLNGGPTIATNTIGMEDRGDGTGLPIVDGYTAKCHWWDNFVHRQGTCPPIDDNLWPQTQDDLPQWSDGITKTMQSSFALLQARSAESLGGYGIRLGIVFDEGISLRDAAQLWNDNLGCRTVNEEHGRVKVWSIDKYADTSTWPRLIHAQRVFGSVEAPRAVDEAMNVIRAGFDWDPDARVFRQTPPPLKSAPAIRRNKRYEKPSKHYDFKMLTEPAFAAWRMNQILGLNQDGPIYVPIEQCDLGVFDFPIGTGVLFTSIMGTGAEGYVDQPIVILDRLTDLDQKTVNLQTLDVGTDKKVIPVANRFLATNTDAIAPIASNDADEAPLAAA